MEKVVKYILYLLATIGILTLIVWYLHGKFGCLDNSAELGFVIMAGGCLLVFVSAMVMYQLDLVSYITLLGFFYFGQYEYPQKKSSKVTSRIHSLLFLLAIAGGITKCTSMTSKSETFKNAFKKTLETSGSVTPKVQYNGSRKAISADFTPWDTEGACEYTNKFIPKSLKSSNPEDIKYIVMIESSKNRVGRYKNGGGAYRIDYDVEIIDLYPYRSLSKRLFQGSSPPEVISGSRGTGSPPTPSEIKNWVKIIIMRDSN